jgi:HSP20 family protein
MMNLLLDEILGIPSEYNKNAHLKSIPSNLYISDGGDYVILCQLPGVDKENLNIEVDNNHIEIKVKTFEDVKLGKIYSREFQENYEISKKFKFTDVDVENITAELKNGILKLIVPKSKKNKDRIKINIV